MLNMYGKDIKREDLPETVRRPENAGSRWRGISPRELANAVVHAATVLGCKVLSDRWSMNDTGMRVVGGVNLEMPQDGNYPEIPGQQYCIAVMNNNDMSRALVAATGTEVTVCNNGMLTGDLILTRKHTTGVDIFTEIYNAMGVAMTQFKTTGEVVQGLIDRDLTTEQTDVAFMEMGRRNILPWSAVGKAWKEYITPTHEVFKQYKGKAFGVYQAANEVIKQRNVSDQLDGLDGLTKLLARDDLIAA